MLQRKLTQGDSGKGPALARKGKRRPGAESTDTERDAMPLACVGWGWCSHRAAEEIEWQCSVVPNAQYDTTAGGLHSRMCFSLVGRKLYSSIQAHWLRILEITFEILLQPL